MNIKSMGSNQTLLTTNHGDEILYSYEIPVAGKLSSIGWFRVDKKYTATTSKHVNKYLKDIEDIVNVTPEFLTEYFKL